MKLAVALAVLLVGSAHGYQLRQPQLDAHKCKVLCQRFGMKALAKKNKAFKMQGALNAEPFKCRAL